MTTAATIRASVYDYLYGAYPTDRPFETTVSEPLDNSETDVDVPDGTNWDEGDILESAETGELMLVTSVATNTLTVLRSYGTVDAVVTTTGTIIRKNPRFAIQKVDNAITEACNMMGSWGIHAFNTGSLTLVASQNYYTVSDTDIDESYGIISVYYVHDTDEQPVFLPFREHFELSSADADWATGRGIMILDKGDRVAGDSDIYYTYAQSLNFDTDLDTTLAKLAPQQEELVVLGAVSRMIGKTIIPATQDPGARTDRTVTPGQTSRDGRWFQGEFIFKSRAEAARLSVLRGKAAGGPTKFRRARRWRG